MGKYPLDAGQMAVFSRRQKANSLAYSDRQRRASVEECRARGLSIADLDDATFEYVAESAGFGMSIAGFPTSLAAAQASHRTGLEVPMGRRTWSAAARTRVISPWPNWRVRVCSTFFSATIYPAGLLPAG
ncbi:hypothetical protein [Azorhizophilus paspali]|uniref:Uncharacterized protein n=1 Tax=Azorhizophilus paspali TaxID=69963 RepID=A0ABV6SQR0_AZOPA